MHSVFGRSLLLFALLISNAQAWDKHQAIMVVATDSLPALKREYLIQNVKLPTPAEEKETIQKVAAQLQVDGSKIPVFTETAKSGATTVRDLIQSSFIDEPDQGMDQNLPDSADRKGDRAWMGGSTGPTSQGFRHMYFPGMVWTSPIQTLQIPFGAIGQAPERFEKLKAISAQFFKDGNEFWGIRTLMWSLHFVQDLTQPFHVTQVPDYRMLPWKKLFSGFVSQSTHSIANFHYAYEGLVLEYINEARISEFNKCFDEIKLQPISNIRDVVQQTRESAPALGSALYRLFGDQMKSAEVNLPEGKGAIDYYQMLHQKEDILPSKEEQGDVASSELKEIHGQLERIRALKEVREISCHQMNEVASYTWSELDQAFHYNETSINTGK
jgi:hypothetical protein